MDRLWGRQSALKQVFKYDNVDAYQRCDECSARCDHLSKKHMIFDSPSLGNASPGLQKMRISTNCPLEPVRTNVEVGSSSLDSLGS